MNHYRNFLSIRFFFFVIFFSLFFINTSYAQTVTVSTPANKDYGAWTDVFWAVTGGPASCTRITTYPNPISASWSGPTPGANGSIGSFQVLATPSATPYRFTCNVVDINNTITATGYADLTVSCAVGTTWNGSTCACNNGGTDYPTCTPPPAPSASFTSTPSCTITAGNSSCISQISWTSANVTYASLTDCGGGPYTSQGPGPATYTNQSGGVTVPAGAGGCYQIHANSFTGAVLATTNGTAVCSIGTTWNGNTCQPPKPTGTITGAGCTVPSGQSVCTIPTNGTNGNITISGLSNVTNGSVYIGALNMFTGVNSNGQTVGTGNWMNPTGGTFYLYSGPDNTSTLLSQVFIAATCASGSSWVGGVCTPNPATCPAENSTQYWGSCAYSFSAGVTTYGTAGTALSTNTAGYVGSLTRTCQSNGTWANSGGSCAVTTCPNGTNNPPTCTTVSCTRPDGTTNTYTGTTCPQWTNYCSGPNAGVNSYQRWSTAYYTAGNYIDWVHIPPNDVSPLFCSQAFCGTSNGGSFASPPSTNLCAPGTASAVTNTGTWSWTCAQQDNTATCSANISACTNGANNPGTCSTHTVISSTGTGGNISPVGAQNVSNGSSISFTITPSAGYAISTVSVDGVNQGAIGSYTFTNVNADHTISASFAIGSCSVPTSQNVSVACDAKLGQTLASGSVTRSQVKSAYTDNPSCVFPALPVTNLNSTYVSDNCSYTCDNGATNPSPGTCNIFTVTPSAVGNGTITPATPQSVASGNTTTFTVTPNAGYVAVMSGSCGGNLVGNTYTTNAITSSCTVVATFSLGSCPAPLSQNVTVPCDPIAGNNVTGLVTRVQYKSTFTSNPACTFPSAPITNINSNYVSDTCVYTCANGALNPTACTVPTVDNLSLSGNNTGNGVINFTCSNTTNYTVTRDGIAVASGNYTGITYINLANYGSIAGNYQVTCFNGTPSASKTVNPYYDPLPLATDAVMLNASPITTKSGTLSTITWSINNPTSLCDIVALPVCAGGNTCNGINDAVRVTAANALTAELLNGNTDANDPYNTTPGVGRSMTGALRSIVTATGTKALGKKTIKIDYTTDFLIDCHVPLNVYVGKSNPTKMLRIQVTDDNEG